MSSLNVTFYFYRIPGDRIATTDIICMQLTVLAKQAVDMCRDTDLIVQPITIQVIQWTFLHTCYHMEADCQGNNILISQGSVASINIYSCTIEWN